jgi:hypothetical protein
MTTYLPAANRHRRPTARQPIMPTTYTLIDGRVCEVRNGCLVDQATRTTVAGSNESAAKLLADGLLTADQRQWIEEWGSSLFPASSFAAWSISEVLKNRTG